MSRPPAKLDVPTKRKEPEPSSDSSPTQSPANDKPPMPPRPMSLEETLFHAGRLAHEYLTRGTLDGRPWPPENGSDPGAAMPETPARAEASIPTPDADTPQASSTPPSSPDGSGCE
ncbi:hypothetical protein BHE74_00011049 [Ensete ventricosum]|uniref:Uncharacterized protein n=1 Tax=Ensete ventricosum TaxID=4639 RepID=A0A426ZB80_ENSVE|nr:hypothetical protein B296_00040270 [Ensete ventricosum]RWW15249.1 hypothetical protein GW17_00020923 [Ensete ventricosum]RWW80594.1 hypothetical protein BHE74_00011049 [Ensete ventricosum]RZR88410.1 hypothetical protein BHM03_00015989 [Ensete ventricosum]